MAYEVISSALYEHVIKELMRAEYKLYALADTGQPVPAKVEKRTDPAAIINIPPFNFKVQSLTPDKYYESEKLLKYLGVHENGLQEGTLSDFADACFYLALKKYRAEGLVISQEPKWDKQNRFKGWKLRAIPMSQGPFLSPAPTTKP